MSVFALPLVPTCRECGCTDEDCRGCITRTGRPCSWTAENLCSACVEPHEFDPHPLNPAQCSYCLALGAVGDPVCAGYVTKAETTAQQRYQDALASGLSDAEARAEGWPGVSFCGHTADEGCTGHGDF